MAVQRYTIEFFQLSVVATPDVPDVQTGFAALVDGNPPLVSSTAGFAREVWQPEALQRPAGCQGQLRKFRMDDFPQVGAIGEVAEELELAENQGIVERNFFRYEARNDLLVWHANGHGSTVNQFARVLSDLWGTRVAALPVLQGDAVRRLLSGAVDIKKIELSIPLPTNPDYYPAQEFSQQVMDVLRGAHGDRIKIEITADARKVQPGHVATLARSVKRAVAELAGANASVARVEAYEDGILHPIDLIADRVTNVQEVDHEGRYAGAGMMFQALADARREVQGALVEYFGGDARINR